MTITEFRSEFDLLYNNTLGEGAPGIDNYEISVYLTTAQEELVKSFYTGNNLLKHGFEDSERNRKALNELVVDYKTNSYLDSSKGLVPDSKFFPVPSDVMFMVTETASIKSNNAVLNGKIVIVKPITHDEFMVSYKNPFRKPNSNRVWRVDISKKNNLKSVELISTEELSQYNARYVKYPNPIIISDLVTDSQIGGLDLTINGKTNVATSELNPYLHREILNRAVELAVRDYRDGSLQTRVQLNNRI
jgi:hypothetical protein